MGERLTGFIRETLPLNESDAGYKYAEIIKPGQSVVIVGPSRSLFIDPIMAEVSGLLYEGRGNIYAVDTRTNVKQESVIASDINLRRMGDGNIENHLTEINVLIKEGAPLKKPQYLPDSSIIDFRLSRGLQADVIIDHDTSRFLTTASLFGFRKSKEISEELLQIYGYYLTQLRENGIVILQMNLASRDIGLHRRLSQKKITGILHSAGFSDIYHYQVEDSHAVRVPVRIWKKLKKLLLTPEFIRMGYLNLKRDLYSDFRNRGYMILNLSQNPVGFRHPCPDLFIASK